MARRNGNEDPNLLNGTPDLDQMFGKGGNDTLNGFASNDLLVGGTGQDRLYGGKGNDILKGGAGADQLYGGADGGAFDKLDQLFGGAGPDRFVFGANGGRDDIMDFQDDIDTIYISKEYYSTVRKVLNHCSSSGGDSAIDLSGNGDDNPRIVIYGVDDFHKLANDIVLF